MAWIEAKTKINGKDCDLSKNKSSDEFNMPITCDVKVDNTFMFNGNNYKVTSVENSRDEFLKVLAVAESQPKPEGKKEDDKSKEG